MNPTDNPSFPVVGIGASAGGLRAIEELLRNLPEQTGMAYVIVQHLSPLHKSYMKDILSKDTLMPILVAEQDMILKPNHIYLAPPGHNLLIENQVLKVESQLGNDSTRFVIDLFLSSLARDKMKAAIGIILSGTGSDGSRGIQRIQEMGGITICQDPQSGDFDGMPQSAIDTGIVNYVLTPSEIGKKLSELALGSQDDGSIVIIKPSEETKIEPILRLLNSEFKVDFFNYKHNTLVRRIEKHMALNGFVHHDQYLDFLKENPTKLENLYFELLIGVTSFFRDKESFKELERLVFPELTQKVRRREEIRIWVCGCSTGEEVYTIAILLSEYLLSQDLFPLYTILATDLNRSALEKAGRGHYSEQEVQDIPSHLLAKYFSFNGVRYEIIPSIREKIIFAHNDVTSDPPFVNLDLVACRNLMIYLKTHSQRWALRNFHFGLKSGSYLFLGASENILDYKDYFVSISNKWKIFKTRGKISGRWGSSSNLLSKRVKTPAGKEAHSTRKLYYQREPEKRGSYTFSMVSALLERYAVPFALINQHFELIYSGGGASQYLKVPELGPTNDILNMVTSETMVALRDSISRIQADKKPVIYTQLLVRNEPSTYQDVHIAPFAGTFQDEPIFLIEWKAPNQQHDKDEVPHTIVNAPKNLDSSQQLQEIQRELVLARQEIQNTMEELETGNEELQSSNEELMAANEELQSTNEELQSLNEELYTVNSELQSRNNELSEAKITIENLIDSSGMGTIHLDLHRNIRLYTPHTTTLIQFSQSDIGNNIDKYKLQWHYPEFLKDIDKVIKSGQGAEKEVIGSEATTVFLVKINPFLNHQAVEGVVINILDISDKKQMERQLKASEQNMRRLLDTLPSMVILFDDSYTITYVNRTPGGFTREEILGANIFEYLGEVGSELLRHALAEAIEAHKPIKYNSELETPKEGVLNLMNMLVPLEDISGTPREFMLNSLQLDGERSISEMAYTLYESYQTLFSNNNILLSIKSHDLVYKFLNRGFINFLKRTESVLIGSNDLALFPQETAISLRFQDQKVITHHRPFTSLDKYVVGDKEYSILSYRFPLNNQAGDISIGYLGLVLEDEFLFGNLSGGTEATNLEKVIEERTEALVQANKEMRTITRSMAHDLRTPLRAVRSYGEMLMDSLSDRLDSKEEARFEKILQQADRMTQIIDGLISYIKIGGISVRKEMIEVTPLIQEVWEELKHLLGLETGRLTLRQCPTLYGDLFLIKQVITNLLSNGIKYRSTDRPLEIEIGAYSDEPSSRWVYYVKDNGMGFDPKYATKIFEVFERLHPTFPA